MPNKAHVMGGVVVQATPEDIRIQRRQCWNTGCKKRHWFRDWCGYKYCLKHWLSSLRWGGGNKWFYFRTTEVFYD